MAFPSLLQLLLPNFNEFTLVGTLIVIAGIAGLVWSPVFKRYFLLAIPAGIAVILVPSFIIDVLNSAEGRVAALAVVFIVLLGYYVMNRGKKKRRRRR